MAERFSFECPHGCGSFKTSYLGLISCTGCGARWAADSDGNVVEVVQPEVSLLQPALQAPVRPVVVVLICLSAVAHLALAALWLTGGAQ